jgi:hypothetical protein
MRSFAVSLVLGLALRAGQTRAAGPATLRIDSPLPPPPGRCFSASGCGPTPPPARRSSPATLTSAWKESQPNAGRQSTFFLGRRTMRFATWVLSWSASSNGLLVNVLKSGKPLRRFAAPIFAQCSGVSFRPVLARRSASRTCAGRGLPRLAAAFLALASGSCDIPSRIGSQPAPSSEQILGYRAVLRPRSASGSRSIASAATWLAAACDQATAVDFAAAYCKEKDGRRFAGAGEAWCKLS